MKKKRISDSQGEHQGALYLGDCLKVLPTLKENSVDLVFGSPPYENVRTYNIGFDLEGQDWVDWMVEVYRASLRVCRGLVAFVVGHGKTEARQWSGTPALLVADLIRTGIVLRNPPIYRRIGISGSGGDDWLRADYEWVVCATNGGKLPWSDNTACGRRLKGPPGGPYSHRTRNGRRVNDTIAVRERGSKKVLKRKRLKAEIANPGNVVDCGVAGGGHMGSNIAHENEAPMQEKLADFFIRSFCPLKGVVLDPFMGSGTTLSVAMKTGRKFMGIDIRESEFNRTLRRVKQANYDKGFVLENFYKRNR